MALIGTSRWKFVVTDLSGNMTTGGGEVLNVTNRTFGAHLNAGKSAGFTIDIANPRGSFILGNDCLLKVYRKTKAGGTWQLLMVGDVIQAEESAQGDSGIIVITAADPYWRFQRRILGMGVDSIGRGVGYFDGTAAAPRDNSLILVSLVLNTNAIYFTGVVGGTITNCGTLGYLGPVYGQNVGDLMQQLCNTLGGPNFEFLPQEPSGVFPNTTISGMNIAPFIGTTRPNAVFEYGTGKRNLQTYNRILTKDGLCNQAYSPPQGFPSMPAAGDTVIIGQDTASQTARGLYQDVIQSDVATTALRQQLANEYVAVRKQARQQITFAPAVDTQLDFNVDYKVGDIVVVRAYVNGQWRFNGTSRVYGVDITIDDNDAETVAVTSIPGG